MFLHCAFCCFKNTGSIPSCRTVVSNVGGLCDSKMTACRNCQHVVAECERVQTALLRHIETLTAQNRDLQLKVALLEDQRRGTGRGDSTYLEVDAFDTRRPQRRVLSPRRLAIPDATGGADDSSRLSPPRRNASIGLKSPRNVKSGPLLPPSPQRLTTTEASDGVYVTPSKLLRRHYSPPRETVPTAPSRVDVSTSEFLDADVQPPRVAPHESATRTSRHEGDRIGAWVDHQLIVTPVKHVAVAVTDGRTREKRAVGGALCSPRSASNSTSSSSNQRIVTV